jgi:hypothetical protein
MRAELLANFFWIGADSMSETNSSTSHRPRFQFSIASLLLCMTVACLIVMQVMTQRELNSLKRELSTTRPLSAKEVARQFEKRTTLASIATKVSDVRYSPQDDSYKIAYSWTDSSTGQTWSSDVFLNADGYGSYVGKIISKEFIGPLGRNDAYYVSVETPPLPLE